MNPTLQIIIGVVFYIIVFFAASLNDIPTGYGRLFANYFVLSIPAFYFVYKEDLNLQKQTGKPCNVWMFIASMFIYASLVGLFSHIILIVLDNLTRR